LGVFEGAEPYGWWAGFARETGFYCGGRGGTGLGSGIRRNHGWARLRERSVEGAGEKGGVLDTRGAGDRDFAAAL
jgi:hypothetical protein